MFFFHLNFTCLQDQFNFYLGMVICVLHRFYCLVILFKLLAKEAWTNVNLVKIGIHVLCPACGHQQDNNDRIFHHIPGRRMVSKHLCCNHWTCNPGLPVGPLVKLGTDHNQLVLVGQRLLDTLIFFHLPSLSSE